MPIREIARRTGLSRNTTNKYQRAGVVEPRGKISCTVCRVALRLLSDKAPGCYAQTGPDSYRGHSHLPLIVQISFLDPRLAHYQANKKTKECFIGKTLLTGMENPTTNACQSGLLRSYVYKRPTYRPINL